MGSLRFAGDFSFGIGLLFAALAAGLIGRLYYRETRALDAPFLFMLPCLRALAVALVVLILTGPIWHHRQVVGTLGRVTFALDVSRSMSMDDSESSGTQPSRLDRAAGLLVGDQYREGWIETLRRTHEVDIVSFADGDVSTIWSSKSQETIPNALPVAATASRTDLSSILSRMLREVDGASSADNATDEARQPAVKETRHAVVMISDGRDNAGRSAVDVSAHLGVAGTKVHTLGTGSAEEPSDLGITDIDHPDNVAADGMLAGRIDIKQVRLDDYPVRFRIESEGRTVWEKEFETLADTGPSIPFQIDVESLIESKQPQQVRGVRRSSIVLDLRAVAEPVPGDTLAQNNEYAFRVGASTRNRQLLILDGSSRWEIRYLRNLFQRDPGWEVTSVLFGPGTDMPQVVRGDRPGQFPNTDQAWSRYDAVILGEVPSQQLTTQDAYLLREFVSRGGGLIVIDGRYDRLRVFAKGAIAQLIPVKYLEGQSRLDVKSIRPTSIGFDQPTMDLTGESTETHELWRMLPSPRTTARVRALEDAEVWADAVGIDGRESPWLVTRLFGAGRVFFVSSDETWRWRYKVADRFHARFWNQLLAAAIQPPYSAQDEFVSIGTDQIEYSNGGTPRIRVRLQNPNGDPVGDATVDALLVKDNQVVSTVPLLVDDPLRGTYEGRCSSLPPGAYTVRVRASGFDEASFLATTPIWVGRDDRAELQQVSLDAETLSDIAKSSGGEYFHESRADELLGSLQPLSNGSIVESDILVWQSFYWFWAVIVTLAIEWWLRKKAGLV